MKIAMTGSSGWIGSHLTATLQSLGHAIVPLERRMFMDLPGHSLETRLEGCEAVVNLAGAPLNKACWTASYRRELYESRVTTTRRLVDAINRLAHPPKVMLSTSAVGYYSSQGCHDDHSKAVDDTFFSTLCQAWEEEALRVDDSTRLVRARFGVVLSPDGGLLKRLLLPIRFGMLFAFSSPNNPFSWISLDDLLRAAAFVLADDTIAGAVNMVAPAHVTNKALYAAMAEHYDPTATIRVPDWLVKWTLGQTAELLTRGQCAIPAKLMEHNFTFHDPDLTTFFNRQEAQPS